MNKAVSTRRAFLARTGSVATGGWLTLSLPLIIATAQTACSRRDQDVGFITLEAADALDLESISEQILPTSDTPGAKAAGVIWFIDAALGGLWEDRAASTLKGLRELNTGLPGGMRFADLPWAEQTEVLEVIEKTEFFEVIRFMTMAGMFAMPSYGGNRDKLGWALIQFQDRHSWQPPFGYYDKDYSGEGSA